MSKIHSSTRRAPTGNVPSKESGADRPPRSLPMVETRVVKKYRRPPKSVFNAIFQPELELDTDAADEDDTE